MHSLCGLTQRNLLQLRRVQFSDLWLFCSEEGGRRGRRRLRHRTCELPSGGVLRAWRSSWHVLWSQRQHIGGIASIGHELEVRRWGRCLQILQRVADQIAAKIGGLRLVLTAVSEPTPHPGGGEIARVCAPCTAPIVDVEVNHEMLARRVVGIDACAAQHPAICDRSVWPIWSKANARGNGCCLGSPTVDPIVAPRVVVVDILVDCIAYPLRNWRGDRLAMLHAIGGGTMLSLSSGVPVVTSLGTCA